MKKGLTIAAIIVGVLLVIMIILPFAFRGKIEGIVKTEGNKMLNAQFDFKSLSISLFKHFPKASVTLNDFWLKGINEFENDTLLKAGELSAAVDLFSLFGENFDISRISIKDTWAKAIVLPDGKANWDIMKSDGSEESTEEVTTEESALSISLKELSINNLNLIYDDRQANMYAEIAKLSGALSGNLGSDQTTLKIEAETPGVTFKTGGVALLNAVNFYTKMNVDADLKNNKFTLAQNEFRLNAIKAGVDGWVELQDPAMDMDLSLNTNEVGFKEILSLIPAIYANDFKNLQTDGTVTLKAHAKGIMQGDTLPQFNAALEVKNAMFRYPSLPAGVDQINIAASAKNPGGSADLTEININSFNFRMAGNPFSLTAEVKTPISDANFKGNAKGIFDLGKVKDVYPLEDMKLNGVVNADLSIEGRMSYVEKELYDKFIASGTIKLTDMKLALKDIPDVDIKQSLFTFTPQYLQLSETTVNIGKNDITADTRFENYLGYIFKDKTIKGTLNIRSSHFNLNDFMSGEVDTTAVAATDTTAMTLIEIPKNIDFNMTANMKQVLFDKMVFNNVNGQLLVKDGKVDMKNLSTNTMGGNVVINGYYSTTNIKDPRMNAAFRMTDLSFSQTYKELAMVQKMAPIFENLKGTFSGNMSINTQLDNQMSPVLPSLQGSGNLSTKNMELSGVKAIDAIADAVKKPEMKEMHVKDMNLAFDIKDGRITTDPFDIKWKDYVLNLSGSTGLDQTINYTGKVKLPESTGVGKYTTLDLKIGGEFSSPKVSVDMESMAKQAVEVAKDKLLDKLGDKLGLSSKDSTQTTTKEEQKEEAVKKGIDALKGLIKKK
ncbi:AsmA family protein [Bacteroides sp. 224]|uniref:AsmA family protein n=1 Tax=Bacteroides sp. 224 TaxID=2302936 RepID=UPI0013D74D04|nr:AsmA family protein [Bacteroides sp. 224]NDV65968.1 AsmA family protein [Bacteroides sp. 224]